MQYERVTKLHDINFCISCYLIENAMELDDLAEIKFFKGIYYVNVSFHQYKTTFHINVKDLYQSIIS